MEPLKPHDALPPRGRRQGPTVPPPRWNPALLGFECPACGRIVAPADVVAQPVCGACAQPLVARYDLERVRRVPRDQALRAGDPDLWRYRAVLPFEAPRPELRLGEGGTPLVALPSLARDLGLGELWLKDESANATQSFKARGLSLAVHGALALGRRAIALPSAGNAGSAAAAYAAAAGMSCRVAVPEDTPEPQVLEAQALGAEVRRVAGTIADAGRAVAEWAPAPDWWNVATFREPLRLEGKKTLGYEIAERLDWRWPDFIFYPTGGGTGLVGMWRAFVELSELEWTSGGPPRLVSVQAAGCAPVVRAFERGAERTETWERAATAASGLRVPSPFAGALILRALRETKGAAVAVSEVEMREGMVALARRAGCYACPEGGATLAALEGMRRSGSVPDGARVVIYNTGSGLKYPEVWRAAVAADGGEA